MTKIIQFAAAAALALTLGMTLTPKAQAGDNANFESNKATALKEVDERIAKLQEHKSCMSAAKDHEAMKACHEKMKEFRESEQKEHMERRKERMEEKMKKMNEKMQEKK